MLDARPISVAVACGASELYERFWRPESFPLWASGLSEGGLVRDGEVWRAQGADGPVAIRFSPRNDHGVLDHWVEAGGGPEVYVPLRVIANREGCLVTLTLFRQPGMTEAKFAEDAAWVERDLATLKRLAEAT